MRAFQMNPLHTLFWANEQKLLKIVPMGFAVDRIHSLVYQWDAWPQSPRGLFLLASIPSPRTIPESIFFEPTYRSLFF